MKYLSKNSHNLQIFITVCFFAAYFIFGLSLLIKQPFGNPPDEYNRYLIPQYIAQNGTLPNGYEESIRIGGYGFSYAFQPILPYMIQGYAMRLVSFFTDSADALLYTARLVDLLFGLCMAYVNLLLGREWFSDRRFSWIFTILVTFLPQSIFVHTYVNTDSCCMLSISIILYGLTLGLKDSFSAKTCVLLSTGIILCALSYYNAYGYILSCILLFTAYFFSYMQFFASPFFDWKAFLKKGLFISAMVLAGIGWWFLRSAILYDGDFLGLRARAYCGSLYALPEFQPQNRITWKSQGYSMWDMLVTSDFLNLSTISFIGVYGPMTITSSIWIYRFYKLLFLIGGLGCICIPFRKTAGVKQLFSGQNRFRVFYHLNMLFCMIMPVILSIYYSYATDYQPQGRYILPLLVPFAYYVVHGLEKCVKYKKLPAAIHAFLTRFLTAGSILLCLCIFVCLAVTIYGYAFPYYEANPIAP